MESNIIALLKALVTAEKNGNCTGCMGNHEFLQPFFKALSKEDLQLLEKNAAAQLPHGDFISEGEGGGFIREGARGPCFIPKDLAWVIIRTFI